MLPPLCICDGVEMTAQLDLMGTETSAGLMQASRMEDRDVFKEKKIIVSGAIL